jgi:hypothetical protein
MAQFELVLLPLSTSHQLLDAIMGLIDVDKVLAELTIHEKIQLLAGQDTWSTFAIERLNIPSITVCICR